MIHLTRLNNRDFVLNADLIKLIENAPDTVITLLNGEKLVVMETIEEILARVEGFHQRSARRIQTQGFGENAPPEKESTAAFTNAKAARKDG
jgi:flagellar protein FlbD